MSHQTINATLCYLKKDNKTLMLHRVKKINDFHQDKYNGLGGKFEPGETPEDCVIREVEEESGLRIIEPKLCGIIMFPLFDGVADWLTFIYTAENFSGELIASPEGNLEWIADEKLSDLPLWGGDHIFLDWIKAERFFSAKFIYEKKQFIDYEVKFY